jgi:hypothetical protein
MIITKHTIKTKAAPEVIWSMWSNVPAWNQWDHGIETGHLDGSFYKGTKGWIKPTGGPKLKFEIIHADEYKLFHDRSYLPLTHLDFIHTMRREGDMTVITYEVEMKGLLTFIFSKLIGSGIKKDMPSCMEKLVQIAETKSS